MQAAFLRRFLWILPLTGCGDSRFSGETLKFSVEEHEASDDGSNVSIASPPAPAEGTPPNVAIPANASGSFLSCMPSASESGRIHCHFADSTQDSAIDRNIIQIELVLDDGTIISSTNHSASIDASGTFSIDLDPSLAPRVRAVLVRISGEGSNITESTVIARIPAPSSSSSEAENAEVVDDAVAILMKSRHKWELNFSASKPSSSLTELLPSNLLNWKLHSSWNLAGDDSDDDGLIDEDSAVVPRNGYIEFHETSSGLMRTRNHWASASAYCNDDNELRGEIKDIESQHPTGAAYDDFMFNSPKRIEIELGIGDLRSTNPLDPKLCGDGSKDTANQCGMAIEHIFDVGGTTSEVFAMKVRVGTYWTEDNNSGPKRQIIFVARAAKSNENGDWVSLFEQPLNKPVPGPGSIFKLKFETDPSSNQIKIDIEGSTNNLTLQYSDSDRIALRGDDRCKISTSVQSGIRMDARLAKLKIQ